MARPRSIGVRHEVFTHTPVLGTVVTVSVGQVDVATARSIDERVLAEMDRLESILSRYRHDSALERWKRDELTDVPPEFAELLGRAAWWTARTEGALDPRAGALTELWRRSAGVGRRPSASELDAALQSLARPGFRIDEAGGVRRVGDCAHLDLHAFGKGWIVDRSLRAALAGAPDAVVIVNAGGDVARAGVWESVLAIEDPFRPYDNAAPVDRVALGTGGLATSGNARRGIEIGGERFSHIIDPRTGRPADGAASVSVIAESAESADAWATALALADPDAIVAAADDAEVAVMAVLTDRTMVANDRWRHRRLEDGPRGVR